MLCINYKNRIKEKGLKGSLTVEMSYILPMVIMLIFLLINTVFYYHDKAVLSGAVAETVETGIEDIRSGENDGEDLETYLKKRVGRKLIFLRPVSYSVKKTDTRVSVKVDAAKGPFKTSVYLEGKVPYPEKELREKKKAEDLLK